MQALVPYAEIELFRRVRVTVPARGSVSTAFLVTVVRSGDAPVIVEASGNGVSDSLFRTIQVKVHTMYKFIPILWSNSH